MQSVAPGLLLLWAKPPGRSPYVRANPYRFLLKDEGSCADMLRSSIGTDALFLNMLLLRAEVVWKNSSLFELFWLGAFWSHYCIISGLVCVAWICSRQQSLEVLSFRLTPYPPSMKIAAFALLVAGASFTPVSQQPSEVMEHRALLARGQPQQSFLQNHLEGNTKGEK